MFDGKKIIELTEKGLLKENAHNIGTYILIKEESIMTQNCKFGMSLWSDGNISFYDNIHIRKLQGDYINNKLTGKGTIKYRKDVLEAINIFNEKYKDIIEYISK